MGIRGIGGIRIVKKTIGTPGAVTTTQPSSAEPELPWKAKNPISLDPSIQMPPPTNFISKTMTAKIAKTSPAPKSTAVQRFAMGTNSPQEGKNLTGAKLRSILGDMVPERSLPLGTDPMGVTVGDLEIGQEFLIELAKRESTDPQNYGGVHPGRLRAWILQAHRAVHRQQPRGAD
jgi:hypothetical protein